ncbi:MAG: hypothetical protein GXO70_05460 [Acidobacteria bacterium]|nr:hypothetical protein [Acidobacteriota bacterium]
MKNVLTGLAVLLVTTSMAFAQMGSGTCDGTGPNNSGNNQGTQAGGSGNGAGGSANGTTLFDLNTVATVSGEVVEFYSLQEDAAATHNLVLLLEDGTTVAVSTAPSWYLNAQEITFNIGDTLTVTGSIVEQETGTVLIASEIISGDTTFILRDELGYPTWKASRNSADGYRNPGTYQNLLYDVASEVELTGTVTEVLVGSMTPGTYPGYQLTVALADGSEIHVQLAPYWYLLNQGFSIETGTEVVITGCTTLLDEDTSVFVARTVSYGDTILVLRDEAGIPLFSGIRGSKNN